MLQLIIIQKDMFIISLIMGAGMGFTYDLIRCFRRLIFHNNFFISVEDIIFWIAWALIIISQIHHYNFGKFRIYVFIGVFLGVTIYALTISKVFIYFMTYILHNLRMFVKKTNKLLKNGARQVKIRVITAKKNRIGKK